MSTGEKQTGLGQVKSSRLKNLFGIVFIFLWIGLVTLVIGGQTVGHWFSFNPPSEIERLHQGFLEFHSRQKSLAVHLIYQHCSCTNSLSEHLIARGPHPGFKEVIVLLGELPAYEVSFRDVGYRVIKKERKKFVDEYGVSAIPILALYDENQQPYYLGGYYKTSAALHPKDKELMGNRGQLNDHDTPLPVYGCAVSDDILRYLDPIGLNKLNNI